MIFFYKPTLTVIATPGDAQVTLDGQAIAAGTPIRLAAGDYTVRVTRDGYLTTITQISLGISQILDLAVELRQIPQTLSLTGSVNFPVLLTNEDRVLYLGKNNAQFFAVGTTLDSSGKAQVTPITPERFSGIDRIAWSPQRDLAVIQASGSTKLFDFQRYDFLNQEERDLDSNLRSVTWHPTSPTIIGYRSTADGERSLISQHIQTGKVERLIDLRAEGFTNPQLVWSPDGRTVAIVEDRIFLFTVSTRTLRALTNPMGASAASWNPQSTQLLIEANNELHVLNATDGSVVISDSIRTNLRKAAWSADGSSILIASSTDQQQDTFSRIDVATGERSDYRYLSNNPINAENLMPNSDLSGVWFTSEGTLYSLVLELDELVIEQ